MNEENENEKARSDSQGCLIVSILVMAVVLYLLGNLCITKVKLIMNPPTVPDSATLDQPLETLPVMAEPYFVVIDPGHQAKGNKEKEPIGPDAQKEKAKVTSGAEGVATGQEEYELNLQVSLRLQSVLEERGYQVVLTRTTPDIDKEQVHKIVRGVSRSARIAYDYPDGHFEYDEIQDPLPFDINAPVIDIKDEDFAIWYRDMTEEMEVYEGKTVHVKGMVARNTGLPQNAVVVGRHIMTCCADDIAYSGLVCNFPMPSKVSLKTRDWIYVTAKIKLEKHKLYNGNMGPVLYATHYETAEEPEEVVATFY